MKTDIVTDLRERLVVILKLHKLGLSHIFKSSKNELRAFSQKLSLVESNSKLGILNRLSTTPLDPWCNVDVFYSSQYRI